MSRAPAKTFKKRVTFKRRPFKKRSFGFKKRFTKRSNSTPSTAKQAAIMKDRTFVTFKYVTLTQALQYATGGVHGSDGYGMLPFPATISPPVKQFVFSPMWSYSSGAAPTLNIMHMLPGNALTLSTTFNGLVGTGNAFSDSFEQVTPTGQNYWALFYKQYLVHGSAVEVTLVDPYVPGQLVVLPIVTEPGNNLDSDIISGYDYDTGNPAGLSNIQQLLSGQIIPDDQPYAKIKLCSAAGGMDRVVIKHRMLTKKLFDVRDLKDADENRANMFADDETNSESATLEPTANQWCWYIAYIPIGAVPTTVPVCSVQVKITYFCELSDRTNIPYLEASA